jgi:hypothetical protein
MNTNHKMNANHKMNTNAGSMRGGALRPSVRRRANTEGGKALLTRSLGWPFGKMANTSVQKRKNEIMRLVLERVESTKRGTVQSASERNAIVELLQELRELSEEDAVNPKLMNGTWRLLWTTEKEILAIIRDGGLASWFGTAAGDVLQVIDLETGSLQNVIEFPPEGAFLVDSSIQFDKEDEKCSFKFRGAALRLPNRIVDLPPMGKSRFQTIYLSKTHRVAFDDRGDYLVVERVGAPVDMKNEYLNLS